MFFAATKLFQARDPHLRRMVYLCIKDICPGSDEVSAGGGMGPAALPAWPWPGVQRADGRAGRARQTSACGAGRDAAARAPQVIIVTSSLMKDMNSNVDLYRANAVRVLCQIVDSQLLAQIERYLKQAVVDKRCAGPGPGARGGRF